MDKDRYEIGLKIRKSVLGADYVEKALSTADDFNMPMQELTTEYCWGAVWGRETLPLKIRSMLNLAMISSLNRPHELKTHIKAAPGNGLTRDEIKEAILQLAIYAGVPCAIDTMRVAKDALAELDAETKKG